MSLPRVHKNTQLTWADLAIFTGVLAFLAYSVQAFLFSPNRAAPKPEKEAVVSAAPAPVAEEKVSRSPASQAAAKTAGATEVLHLPCLHNAGHSFSSDARILQIHAPFCRDDALQTGAWKARNESSGEEILVFVNRKEKTFSTNYFNLKNGANRIVFSLDLGKGQSRTETLEVNRSPRTD